jgi:DNA repair exonuclease SbcCD nuclease subunit
MKFLHTADWQVGMRAAHLGDKGERVRQARLESARRVVEEARREKVDFIIVAGDTFEDNGVDRVKVREVARIMGGAGCPVFVIPGNHDQWKPGSVWEDAVWSEWPKVQVFKEAKPVDIGGAVLYPCPVFAGDSMEDPTAWIRSSGAKLSVGIAHGSVENAGYEQAMPIARNAATAYGLDYLALGHFHSKALYPDESGAYRMAYSGTHEATKFGEYASGNALIVEIAGRGAPPQIQTIRTGCLEWLSYKAKIERPGELAALAAELEALAAPERTLVECTLEGTLFGSEYDALARLVETIEGRFLFGRCDVTRLAPNHAGPEWIEQLPEGFLQDAARGLLGEASSAPPDLVAAAALREFARLWREAAR